LSSLVKHRVTTESGGADRALLGRLVVGGPARATHLAAALLMDLSVVSRQVRSLVQRGLVERRPDPDDRRGTLLTPTDAGRKQFEEYRRQSEARFAALLRSWPPEDRYQLVRLIGRLNDDMADRFLARHGDSWVPGEQGETAR
jgi:DNA-binding MarR family transcriptional regulator